MSVCCSPYQHSDRTDCIYHECLRELYYSFKKTQLQQYFCYFIEPTEPDKKEKSKDKKSKDKKEKDKVKKVDGIKKAKKKDKDKTHHKKGEKKSHKSKKKSKHHEMIRPNIPPLLMNMEKESEPSITDVFAGQILKNHGINLETTKVEKIVDKKPDIIAEIKRPILPIIDPATICTQPDESMPVDSTTTVVTPSTQTIEEPTIVVLEDTTASREEPTAYMEEPTAAREELTAPREEQIKEINEIEAKIQGLKQKLAEQLDSMSDDEDFLNIRTEAEELMNDFAEDVFQVCLQFLLILVGTCYISYSLFLRQNQ